jgi:hypothetical protein
MTTYTVNPKDENYQSTDMTTLSWEGGVRRSGLEDSD